MNNQRFGTATNINIDDMVSKSTPYNTVKTKKSIWNQFDLFCKEKGYNYSDNSTKQELATILQDWAANMRKCNGEEYKESAVKTIWNTTAKSLQEYYYNNFKIVMDPFKDIEFKAARDARNATRRKLQANPNKRKQSSVALSEDEIKNIIKLHDENTPNGLQKKFFHVASYELAWRGGEAAKCLTHYFKEELNHDGTSTTRLEYNPIFNKTNQGGSQKCADSKWLTCNIYDIDICPVRLFKKLLSKRGDKITTERLFLTENRSWNLDGHAWFKNMPVGANEISKWTKQSADIIGINVKNIKINYSHRSTTVTHLAKRGVNEHQLIKITGHGSAQSIKPYLQMDKEHHGSIIDSLRKDSNKENHSNSITSTSTNNQIAKRCENARDSNIIYNNCTFHVTNMHC